MSDAIERLAATVGKNLCLHCAENGRAWEMAEAVLSALHLSPDAAAGLADGSWVAVPREPSEAMRKAGMEESRMLHVSHPSVSRRESICTGEAGDIYRAMIAASQQNGEK